MDAWPASAGEALHTTTFLGNPLGCAMALKSIELHFDPEMPKRVRALGRQFVERLREIDSPWIGDIRGLGLLIGIELVDKQGSPASSEAARIVNRSLGDGLLLLSGGPNGNVLSLTPPFCVEPGEIDFVCQRLEGYLRFGSVS
jgi:4-aminobutyrate aminotransferase-like enzyme